MSFSDREWNDIANAVDRALCIKKGDIRKTKFGWKVKSQSEQGTYRVTSNNGATMCDCPSYQYRGTCKHSWACLIKSPKQIKIKNK